MSILLWIIMGALAGWVASLIAGTDADQGALMNIVLGIVGAMVGGFIISIFGLQGPAGFNIYSLIVSVFGAIVLIWLSRLVYR